MSNYLKSLCAVPALLLVVTAAPVPAGEGRFPVWQPITIAPGDEGKYVLTRDVTANAGAPAIDIQPGVAAVDIDLNGFTIRGLDTDVIRAEEIDGLTVRNGMIRGGLDGIHVEVVEKLVIENVTFQLNGGDGIHASSVASFAIRDNIVAGSGASGMYVVADVPGHGSIENNLIRETGADGIALIGNVAGGYLIAGNSVMSAGNQGLDLLFLFASKVYNNLTVDSTRNGILLTGDNNFILDNVASQNGDSGIVVTNYGWSHIERNVMNDNGKAGLWIASGNNTYGRNTARGNLGMPTPCAATPPACTPPDICVDDATSTSFGDNMGPGAGC